MHFVSLYRFSLLEKHQVRILIIEWERQIILFFFQQKEKFCTGTLINVLKKEITAKLHHNDKNIRIEKSVNIYLLHILY